MLTNDVEVPADVNKKPNRVRKPAVAKFVPLNHVDADGHEKLPRPHLQEPIVALWDALSEKDQRVIMAFIGSPEFMAPGYGKSVRFMKQWVARSPRAVKLPR